MYFDCQKNDLPGDSLEGTTAMSAALGGTISSLSGGSFTSLQLFKRCYSIAPKLAKSKNAFCQNGAMTAAFANLYNEWGGHGDDGTYESEEETLAASKRRHYGRNRFNKDYDGSDGWYEAAPEDSIYHQHGQTGNRKFIHIDGYETVLDVDGKIVTTPENMGTFNFGANPHSWEHIRKDIMPYWVWGNSPEDNTPPLNRVFP